VLHTEVWGQENLLLLKAVARLRACRGPPTIATYNNTYLLALPLYVDPDGVSLPSQTSITNWRHLMIFVLDDLAALVLYTRYTRTKRLIGVFRTQEPGPSI